VNQDAGQADGLPSLTLSPGSSEDLGWHKDPHGIGAGTAVKLSPEDAAGVLQFEYTFSDNMYWDLSDLDGGGAGVVTSPFRDWNVVVTPTGNGASEGGNGCSPIFCEAGQTCEESYQYPDQAATRACPADVGDFFLDLCTGGSAAPASAPALESDSENGNESGSGSDGDDGGRDEGEDDEWDDKWEDRKKVWTGDADKWEDRKKAWRWRTGDDEWEGRKKAWAGHNEWEDRKKAWAWTA
jgi:hypothetical protein